MQSAREELRGRKPGEALSLSGRFKRKLNRPVLFLPSRTVHAVNISFQVPANQELTDWSKRPPRDTFWPKAWCWSEDHLFWCVSFYFQREAVAGLALTDANKTARHSGWKHLPAGVLYVLDFWKTKFLNPEKFPCRWVPLSFDSNNRMFRFFMLGCLFFFFFYHGSAKSSEPGNTSVYSENHLSVFTTFTSDSVFSVQLLVLSTLGFYLFFACFVFFFCRFEAQLFFLFLLRETFVLVHQLYRTVGKTSVQECDTLESKRVSRTECLFSGLHTWILKCLLQ